MSTPKRVITRVRTGCLKCRIRKKKCDERQPICRACERNQLECEWPASARRSRDSTERVDERRGETPIGPGTDAEPERDSPVEVSVPGDAINLDAWYELDLLNDMSTALDFPLSEYIQDSYSGPLTIPHDLPQSVLQPLTVGVTGPVCSQPIVSHNPSTLPSHLSEAQYNLLGHYITRTAQSMSNGLGPSNRFITQLLPLAFANDMILQLLLTQSAVQRDILAASAANKPASRSEYSRSLALFRTNLDEHIKGSRVDPLPLVTAALILCFTETARGDVHGAIFDHLSSASTLLLESINKSSLTVPEELQNFWIEYYTYTATLSMIAIDARVSTQRFLDPQVEELAKQLAKTNYCGNLCGSWLELLLLIPEIFELARSLRNGPVSTATNISMTFVRFARTQRKALLWAPRSCSDALESLMGRLFQQAILIYLYTAVNVDDDFESVDHQILVDAAVDESVSIVENIPPGHSSNTSLCWPLAVVGSCVQDDYRKNILRARLRTMQSAIGLGNISQTLDVLEGIWASGTDSLGPWNICKMMQKQQVFMSFA